MSKLNARPRLGRGLNALLAGNEEPAEGTLPKSVAPAGDTGAAKASPTEPTPWRMVTVAAVRPNPHQPRRDMNPELLAELAASIKANGLIQPIVVRETSDGFELIAGERRLRAAQLAKVEQIPAVIRETDAYTQAQLALVENIHRADLNPIERAAAYQSLINQLGLTQAELAQRLGEQRSSIANYLRLLALSPAVREHVVRSELSLGHAKILAGVDDPAEQERLASLCREQDLTVRNLERLIETSPPTEQLERESPTPQNHFKALETSISRQIGLRVQLRATAKGGKGRLIIHYKNLDQFDDLAKRLGISATIDEE